MNLLEIYFAFTLGLVGSLHCLQMCGPIVLSYSLPLASHSRGRQMAAHLAYNLGRITTYAALGAVAGSAGAAVGLMGRLAGIEHVAAMVAGSLMIVAGIFMSGLIPRGQLARLYSFRPASRIAKAIGRPMQSPTAASKFTMGLALGFLPCGLIYAALLKAVFDAKRVPLRLLGRIGDYREYHRPDFASVEATVKPSTELKSFDFLYTSNE